MEGTEKHLVCHKNIENSVNLIYDSQVIGRNNSELRATGLL